MKSTSKELCDVLSTTNAKLRIALVVDDEIWMKHNKSQCDEKNTTETEATQSRNDDSRQRSWNAHEIVSPLQIYKVNKHTIATNSEEN